MDDRTGLVYLKERLTTVGTVFTTHATAVGRSVAGNNGLCIWI